VPEEVEFSQGSFTNAQGLKLATFAFVARGATPTGIVLLLVSQWAVSWLRLRAGFALASRIACILFCHKHNVSTQTSYWARYWSSVIYLVAWQHGYASHTQFEWFRAPAPGEAHTQYKDTVIEACVCAGLAVHAIDHQSHGRSEDRNGLRASFERFAHLADEACDYVELLRADAYKGLELPIFLWSVSMGGATALTMARKLPADYLAGIVLYAPMISLERVRQEEVGLGIRNAHLEPLAGALSLLLPDVAIGQTAKNTVHPHAQQEFDNDALNYTGNVRSRVAEQV
jgi:hypothetical protein